MKWVTRSGIMVDRVACAWLIRRFIDSEAQFIFAPETRIKGIMENEGANSFDTAQKSSGQYSAFAHVGTDCSFQTLVKAYDLSNDVLDLMGEIIRDADGHDPIAEPHPAAFGLKVFAKGFSLMNIEDEKNLDAQMSMYDALYSWCRFKCQVN